MIIEAIFNLQYRLSACFVRQKDWTNETAFLMRINFFLVIKPLKQDWMIIVAQRCSISFREAFHVRQFVWIHIVALTLLWYKRYCFLIMWHLQFFCKIKAAFSCCRLRTMTCNRRRQIFCMNWIAWSFFSYLNFVRKFWTALRARYLEKILQ